MDASSPSMLRIPWPATALLALAMVLLPRAAHAQGGEERIRTYQVTMQIQPDGVLHVVERIDYDFDSVEHHGIYRDIPVRLYYNDRYDRVYPLDVISVHGSPGTPVGYKVEKEGNKLRIRIGDPNRTITGHHVYTIAYQVKGALNTFPDHDELYWNAIGGEWSVPIGRSTVRVQAPATVTRVACFSGPYGSNLPCTKAAHAGRTATFTQSGLDPYSAMTVVLAVPPEAITPAPHPILDERFSLSRAFAVTPLSAGLGGFALLAVLGAIGWLLWTRGRDRRYIGSPVDVAYGSADGREQPVPVFERGPTPVEYGPPDGIRPGEVGTLIDEAANPLDVTASVIDLAVRGYLRIEEIPKHGWFGKPDWRLVKLKEADGTLLEYERTLFDGLFQDADDEENQAEAPPRPDGLEDTAAAPTAITRGLAAVRLSNLKTHFVQRLHDVQEALYRDAMARGWFAGRPDKVRKAWGARGWIVLAAGIGLTWLAAARSHLGLVPLPVILGGLLLIWGAHWMPRRTAKGTGAVQRVRGFRTYIETAERDESRFAERANLFYQYLPYAVVFGVTEKWARAFRGLSAPPPNTWYVGQGPFTTAALVSSIDSFAITSAGTIASTPSSSGSSGFGGGGFSGGGGGGGGGGSW